MPTNHRDKGPQRERPHGAAADLSADRPRSLPVRPAIDVGTRARKSRRWWVLLALLALIVFGRLLLACGLVRLWAPLFWPTPDIRPDEAAIKRKVAEALPLGSTKEQVEAWFKGQCLPYNNVIDVGSRKPVGFGAHMPYSKQFLSGEAQMYFHFNRDGKLDEEIVRIFIPLL